MTNGDRIRQMSNEELAEILFANCKYCNKHIKVCMGDFLSREANCEEGIKAYLESEEE